MSFADTLLSPSDERRADVPHLTTALTGPLLELEKTLLDEQPRIEQWLRRQWRETPAPFYSSMDLRNAGFKLAPVDTNLFPAGFNNLNPSFRPLGVQAIQAGVELICPTARGVLLIPENHTRNIHYFESLAVLIEMLTMAGLQVRVGSLLPNVAEPRKVELPSGREITLEPLVRDGGSIRVADFDPCFVLLNNDLSGGRPAVLENLKTPVVPPLDLGWSNRLKSQHFAHYRRLAAEFAGLIDIDPWLIDPLFRRCTEINFQNRDGEECLASNVDELLAAVGAKYREYGIAHDPFVIIKADAGTYGMAIMTVKSAADVRDLNRKQRTRMARTKEGLAVTDVIVQEGVYTFETLGTAGAVAEPVVYMIGRYVIGGFYRVHTARGPDENLNAPGMHFEPLAFADPCTCPVRDQPPEMEANRFYAYGVIGRLAAVAAAREIRDVQPPSSPD